MAGRLWHASDIISEHDMRRPRSVRHMTSFADALTTLRQRLTSVCLLCALLSFLSDCDLGRWKIFFRFFIPPRLFPTFLELNIFWNFFKIFEIFSRFLSNSSKFFEIFLEKCKIWHLEMLKKRSFFNGWHFLTCIRHHFWTWHETSAKR